MSLTNAQKKDLKNLGSKLREFQQAALDYSIDLDVFMTEYREDGVYLYSTEKISRNEEAIKRKNVFEKQNTGKKTAVKHL